MEIEPIKKFDIFIGGKKDETPMEMPKHHQHEMEPEYEMILGQLQNICDNAQELMGMLKGKEEIEDWVQSKITIADDYINKLRNYYKYNQ